VVELERSTGKRPTESDHENGKSLRRCAYVTQKNDLIDNYLRQFRNRTETSFARSRRSQQTTTLYHAAWFAIVSLRIGAITALAAGSAEVSESGQIAVSESA
jgi:hypothetical protein